MVENNWETAGKLPEKWRPESNVKHRRTYERFGETIRYLTVEELQKLFDHVTDYRHKLMFRLIYELGCRVGESVRIRLSHMDFSRGAVYFPAENTKTGHFRTSHVPQGLTNEILSMLKREGRAAKRDGRILHPDTFLFHPPGYPLPMDRPGTFTHPHSAGRIEAARLVAFADGGVEIRVAGGGGFLDHGRGHETSHVEIQQ